MHQKQEIRYPFNNHIMFAKVMKNPEICKEFIQRLFYGRKVTDIKVSEVTTVAAEAAVIPGIYSKSVRLDVLFDDDASWYNIEMQVARESDLPQRGRYYSAAIDVAHLKPGKPYGELKQSFVIFFCLFDYYGLGEAIYSFERFDKNLQLPFSDGSYIILLNTICSEEKIPQGFHGLFHYIDTEEVEDDWFVEKIHQLVIRYQNDEEVSYMATLEDEYLRKMTKAEREGRAEGAAEMAERLNKLTMSLIKESRISDLEKAASDPDFQKQLLEEFGI